MDKESGLYSAALLPFVPEFFPVVPMSPSTVYDALAQGLTRAGAIQNPADVHGTLTGMLCVNDNANPLAALDDEPDESIREALSALREMTLEGLFDSDLSFAPLLPDDEVALTARVHGLARWCSGFLYGLASQQGETEDFDLSRLSPEAGEVIKDLTELSRVGLSDEDSDESAEVDYAELVEYVRVGVQMIFMELRPKREGPETRERLH